MSAEHSSAFSEPGYARTHREEKKIPWFLLNIDKALTPEVGIPLKI